MAPNKLHLELHVEDFETQKHYYHNLGFRTVWERPPEGFKGYLVMEMNDNILCFWCGNKNVYEQSHFKQFPHDTPRGYGIEIIIQVKNIHEFYEKFKDTANIVEPLSKQPWDLWDFRAIDPAGYYLRFTSEHDVLDSIYAVK